MKKKIKSIARYAWVAAYFLPVVTLAQWKKPDSTQLPTGSIYNIIQNIMKWLLGILGFVAVIGFVISGIMFLVSAGDEDRQKSAKKAMYYSITGVIVGLVGYVVLVAVEKMLSGTSTTF